MKTIQLTDRIRLFEFDDMQDLFGVNQLIGLIEEPQAYYLIDSGLGPDQIEPILRQLDKPVHLILTHSHWDHIWGAEAIPGEIYAHRNYALEVSPRMLKKFKRYRRGVTYLVDPTVLVDESLRVERLELFATPGHTLDGLSIWDPVDKALFVGDLVFIKYRNEDIGREHLASLHKLLDLPFDYLIPGHIGVMSRAELSAIIAKLEREIVP